MLTAWVRSHLQRTKKNILRVNRGWEGPPNDNLGSPDSTILKAGSIHTRLLSNWSNGPKILLVDKKRASRSSLAKNA